VGDTAHRSIGQSIVDLCPGGDSHLSQVDPAEGAFQRYVLELDADLSIGLLVELFEDLIPDIRRRGGSSSEPPTIAVTLARMNKCG
jgi:hypothetical protein